MTRNPQGFAALLALRLARRDALKGLAAGALAATSHPLLARAAGSTLRFTELPHGIDEHAHVAPGHDIAVLLRWGDPILAAAPAFDPLNQTAAAQAMQFGYNCDFACYMPLPIGSGSADRGLLCVNHEYTNASLMFPDTAMTKALTEVEMAAHGHSVVEIARHDGRWSVVRDGRYNRRITTLSTAMRIAGPAAGSARLATAADPGAARVIGTLANCAGGTTPWGTVLIAEENIQGYFSGDPLATGREAGNYRRMGFGKRIWFPAWGLHHDRFNMAREPNEPNRFGWIVEVDPYDPAAMPVKRTSLGRFSHEAANTVVSRDGRVVVYSGDDAAFQYLYRFVTTGAFNPEDRAANRDLLDDGILSVARFSADGGLRWLPLVFGDAPLTPDNGFHSQADVVIEARRAGDLVGATPMDRPEDVEVDPLGGRVYVVLTKNKEREAGEVDAANPRGPNKFGHIIELTPPGASGALDHAAATFEWDILLLAGDPAEPGHGAGYHPGVSPDGWFAAPDNCTFDSRGRLWIATDGMSKAANLADGLYACDTGGPGRALTRHFFDAPRGAEVTGPYFTPDDTTLFVSVQHPGLEAGSTFAAPSTRWPDFAADLPPRPSVVAITRNGGGPIGG